MTRSWSPRLLLQRLHRWLGLALLLPLAIQGLTGTILTLELPFRPVLEVAAAPGQAESVQTVVAAARAAVPPGLRPTRYLLAPVPARAAEVWFAPQAAPGGRASILLRIDPVTLLPLGPAEPVGGAMDWLRRLHTNFLLPDFGGRAIVGWVGVGLVLLSGIGIPLWWPRPGRWREAFTVPPGSRGLRLQRRLHGAAGIWALAMLLMTSTTGAVLGFPQTVRAVLGMPGGGPPRPARPDAAAPLFLPDLDAATVLARNAAPGQEVRAIFLPSGKADPIRFFLRPPGQEGAVTTTAVTIDAAASRVLNVQSPQSLTAAETGLRWVHDLHEGEGLGPLWRGITAITGVALPLMAFTGAAMWLLRRRKPQTNGRRPPRRGLGRIRMKRKSRCRAWHSCRHRI